MFMIWVLSLIKIVCLTNWYGVRPGISDLHMIYKRVHSGSWPWDTTLSGTKFMLRNYEFQKRNYKKIDPCDILSKIAILCQPLFIAIFVLHGVLEPWVTLFYFLQEQWPHIPGEKNPSLGSHAVVCEAHTASTVFSPFGPKVTALPSGKSNIWEQCFVPKRIDAWESKLTSPAWFTLQEPCINDESGVEVKTKAHRYAEPRLRKKFHMKWGTCWVNPTASHTILSSVPGLWFCVYVCVVWFVGMHIYMGVNIQYVQVHVCTWKWKTTGSRVSCSVTLYLIDYGRVSHLNLEPTNLADLAI